MQHLSRRSFLASSALAAAALATRSMAQPERPATRRTLRKAVMYGMIGPGATIEDKFKLIRDCGFAGVEMD